LANGDKVFALMTSNATCANPTQVRSDTLTTTCILPSTGALLEYFYVSPNPATGKQTFINMSTSQAKQVQYRILDARGNLLYASGKETWIGVIKKLVKMPNSAQGIVMLEINIDGNKTLHKIVVN
jgi:hypothetical protein